MTAQIGEKLCYEGREMSMCSEPLSDYFSLLGIDPRFAFTCTALWRGYLIALNGSLEDGTDVNIATFFPDLPERVFAHWYSGNLRIPQGKLLKYVHGGYGSTYEGDLIISIDKGVVVATNVQHHGTASNPKAPEGYQVGGMYAFPTNQ